MVRNGLVGVDLWALRAKNALDCRAQLPALSLEHHLLLVIVRIVQRILGSISPRCGIASPSNLDIKQVVVDSLATQNFTTTKSLDGFLHLIPRLLVNTLTSALAFAEASGWAFALAPPRGRMTALTLSLYIGHHLFLLKLIICVLRERVNLRFEVFLLFVFGD